jgi:hypothetical protein
MARPLVKVALVAAAMLGATSAGAQFNPFGGLFGNPPPRPPASMPGGRQQMGTPLPQPGTPAPYGGVQSQPLPPPPGSQANQGAAGAAPRPQRDPPQRPFDPATLPSDDVVAEPPSQKITNTAALFSGLDKITGRITSFDVTVGETVQFGALQLTPRACYTRPPTETANTDAFVEVDEITLQGEVRRVFNGWMFASSPGLNAVEHPIYDIWLTACKGPVVAAVPPEPQATTPARPQRTPSAADPSAPRPQRTPQASQQPTQPPQPVQRRPQPPAPTPAPQQTFTPFGR